VPWTCGTTVTYDATHRSPSQVYPMTRLICHLCRELTQIVADLLFEDEQPLSDWEPSHVKRIALHDQQTFTRRGPGDKGRVRWIHGRNPWTWT
jgi:hypothetical protein